MSAFLGDFDPCDDKALLLFFKSSISKARAEAERAIECHGATFLDILQVMADQLIEMASGALTGAIKGMIHSALSSEIGQMLGNLMTSMLSILYSDEIFMIITAQSAIDALEEELSLTRSLLNELLNDLEKIHSILSRMVSLVESATTSTTEENISLAIEDLQQSLDHLAIVKFQLDQAALFNRPTFHQARQDVINAVEHLIGENGTLLDEILANPENFLDAGSLSDALKEAADEIYNNSALGDVEKLFSYSKALASITANVSEKIPTEISSILNTFQQAADIIQGAPFPPEADLNLRDQTNTISAAIGLIQGIQDNYKAGLQDFIRDFYSGGVGKFQEEIRNTKRDMELWQAIWSHKSPSIPTWAAELTIVEQAMLIFDSTLEPSVDITDALAKLNSYILFLKGHYDQESNLELLSKTIQPLLSRTLIETAYATTTCSVDPNTLASLQRARGNVKTMIGQVSEALDQITTIHVETMDTDLIGDSTELQAIYSKYQEFLDFLRNQPGAAGLVMAMMFGDFESLNKMIKGAQSLQGKLDDITETLDWLTCSNELEKKNIDILDPAEEIGNFFTDQFLKVQKVRKEQLDAVFKSLSAKTNEMQSWINTIIDPDPDFYISAGEEA